MNILKKTNVSVNFFFVFCQYSFSLDAFRIQLPIHVSPIIVLDASLINTQHLKVRIKGKGIIERKELRPYLHLGVVAIKKEAFGSHSTTVAHLIYICVCVYVCAWRK